MLLSAAKKTLSGAIIDFNLVGLKAFTLKLVSLAEALRAQRRPDYWMAGYLPCHFFGHFGFGSEKVLTISECW